MRAVCAKSLRPRSSTAASRSLFRRKRPVPQFERPYHLRMPRTTSFPSGHATASFTAAVLLSDGTPWAWFCFPIACDRRVQPRSMSVSTTPPMWSAAILVGLLIGFAIAHFRSPTLRTYEQRFRLSPSPTTTAARGRATCTSSSSPGSAVAREWDVTFQPFSLNQAHVEEGGTPVWDNPEAGPSLLAALVSLVIRDEYPDKFLDAHEALFAARHDKQLDTREPSVIAETLAAVGLDDAKILEAAGDPARNEQFREIHLPRYATTRSSVCRRSSSAKPRPSCGYATTQGDHTGRDSDRRAHRRDDDGLARAQRVQVDVDPQIARCPRGADRFSARGGRGSTARSRRRSRPRRPAGYPANRRGWRRPPAGGAPATRS